MQESPHAVELTAGGITGDTELVTAAGPTAVANLDIGTRVYALNPTTGLAKLKPITKIETFDYQGSLIHAEARRVDLLLHPNQRLPYRTGSISRTRFQRAGDLDDRELYHFLNQWQTVPGDDIETVDITDLCSDFEACATIDSHGHTFRAALPEGCEPTGRNGWTGYHFDAETFKRYQGEIESLATDVTVRARKNTRRRPYRFDGDDFVRFIGWFVTEGSTTWRTDRDTAVVSIAQKTDEHRTQLRELFNRMGIDCSISESGFSFGSTLYADLLEELCGASSQSKRLPDFVWGLNDGQQKLLLSVLMDGDGNDWGVYYTSSRQLAGDVARLCLKVGIKPRYNHRDGMWELYIGEVNDRLTASKQVSTREDEDRALYRLTVDDYSVVMMGRNGKFQWVGISAVS
jgi:hypothetical protein